MAESDLLGPFEVEFPVKFYSGGDTTRDAFSKHIQEIKRIYGILNALDSGKASSLAIAKAILDHVNSNNPHPNWKPSMNFSDISGNLDANRVYGLLSNATINASKVIGLEALINNKVPDISGLINDLKDLKYEEPKIEGKNGYMKLPNGMIIQWGVSTDASKTGNYTGRITFNSEFPTACVSVTGCTYLNDGASDGKSYPLEYNFFHINTWDKTGFGYATATDTVGMRYITYQAIGY